MDALADPTWLSLLPAVVTITLAFATRQVITSLFAGILTADNPGYVMVEMELSDETLMLVNDTPGVGGVLGSMTEAEAQKMLSEAERTEEEPTTKITLSVGDRVRIKEGLFQNFDGEIEEIWPEKGQVRVIVSILGRPTPVELEYWQLESI